MELAQIKIYRMTHIDNIPHILEYGITHKSSPNANPNFITIGDISLIDTRNTKSVSVDNGDFLNFEAPTIILGEHIPFYFGVKMPMLYVMQHGGNFVKKATPAREIIYIACSIVPIINSNFIYYFSDGHGTDSLTTFYDSSEINRLPDLIHWPSVFEPYWGGQENLNLKRKKQAEFLVRNDLPVAYIFGFGCYNQEAKNKLIEIGVEENKIRIIPNSYY